MEENGYAADAVPHRFMRIERDFVDQLETAEAQIRAWFPVVDANERTAESLAHLRIALQCGGSDAFSGVSGNPLVSWVAKEVIRYGGGANLAETDELIGAEPYVLQNVRDADTAQRFLDMVARFKDRVAWHGESAEGNPSGGNKFRGLLQYCAEINRRRHETPSRRAARLLYRIRRTDARAGLLLYGQSWQRPREYRRTGCFGL